MWKFKASKYKNAVPKLPKKEEWISDISANNLLSSYGNHISASSAYLVFNTDSSGPGNLGVLPTNSTGRHHSSSLSSINAHSEYVTDFTFSPFDDYLLATCSQDHTVKIWHLPETLDGGINTAIYCLPSCEKRVENVKWHPCVSAILGVTSGNTLKIYDVAEQKKCFEFDAHDSQIQSMTWNADGSLIATSCRDLVLRIIDPRSQAVVQQADGYPCVKDSRVLWMGDRDLILSSGYNKMRQREVKVHDSRNLSTVLKTLDMSSSMGTIMPLFDPDTNMLFLTGKGDTSISYIEVTTEDPYLTQNTVDTVEQVKGVCMVPKRALDVMSGEVNRLLVLCKNYIIPHPYIVPRKTYAEFHADLFPDTFCGEPSMSVSQWKKGQNIATWKTSLDPSKNLVKRVIRTNPQELFTAEISSRPIQASHKSSADDNKEVNKASCDNANSAVDAAGENATHSVKSKEVNISEKTTEATSLPSEVEPPVNPAILKEKKQHQIFQGVRQSKFRHLEGSTHHKSQNIENIRNLCQTVPGESDMFQANEKFCAITITSPAGLIQIHKTTEPGRLPEADIPVLQNGCQVTDFVFDPFNSNRLVVACDDANMRVWDIPDDGIAETMDEPTKYLMGHMEKIYFVRFHPLAKDVLASGSYDMAVKIWDVSTGETVLQLEGHTDTIFSFAWSSDGKYCCTVCKDGKLRMYEPRKLNTPVKEGSSIQGTRGARVLWVCQDKYLAVTGFNRMTNRCVTLYSVNDLNKTLASLDFDTAPAILIPHYDEDSSTLFLTGRGDGVIKALEVCEEHPHLFQLSDYNCSGLHQGLSFLSKQHINVKNVEFARALRLTPTSIEPISFTVPRIKTEFFQDDIFPETKVTWEPVLTSSQWFSGEDGTPKMFSLKPKDMQNLSEAPVQAPKPKKYESFQEYQQHYKTDDQKKEELLSAMNAKLDVSDNPLPQDLAEGVDDDEWDD